MTQRMLSQVREAIEELQKKQDRLIIAIDGRCAAGKTTLAAYLQEMFDCHVFHMDDFFLTPDLRTEERLAQPGGNVDYVRFYREVLLPVMKGDSFSYRPYSCHLQQLIQPVAVAPKQLNIVEGSYSCHPQLWDCYHLRIFMDIDPMNQRKRILERNGKESFVQFEKRWIPLEELYFRAYEIQKRCDLYFLSE